jgi:FixJ family two-component response regulator
MGAVLVVDDVPLVLASMCGDVRSAIDKRREAADAYGLVVETAATFAEAKKRLEAPGDVAGCLLDLHLGDHARGGLELGRLARRRDPDLPIVLVTGRLPAEIGDAVGRELFPCIQKGRSLREPVDKLVGRVVRHASDRAAVARAGEARRVFAADIDRAAENGNLTHAERAYVHAYARGLPDKVTAPELGIAIGTLNDRRRAVIRKLGVDCMRRALFKIIRLAYRDLNA